MCNLCDVPSHSFLREKCFAIFIPGAVKKHCCFHSCKIHWHVAHVPFFRIVREFRELRKKWDRERHAHLPRENTMFCACWNKFVNLGISAQNIVFSREYTCSICAVKTQCFLQYWNKFATYSKLQKTLGRDSTKVALCLS